MQKQTNSRKHQKMANSSTAISEVGVSVALKLYVNYDHCWKHTLCLQMNFYHIW